MKSIKNYKSVLGALLMAIFMISAVPQSACTSPRSGVVITGNSICELWLKARPDYFAERGYINVGICGETSTQIAARMERDVLSHHPATVVIISPATNDVAENEGPVTDDFVMENIRTMASQAQDSGARVVLVSNLPASRFKWRPDIEPMERLQRLNASMQQLADSMGLQWVDMYTPMLDANGDFDSRYHVDGCHPSAAGHDLMQAILDAALE